MRQLEAALKAAADPNRTRILKLLEGGETCVCQIQAVLALAPSTVSKHLSLLKAAGLVDDRRDGRWIHYRLADPPGNAEAARVLDLVRAAANDEPRVREDRARMRQVRRVPLVELCAVPPAERPARAAGRKERPRA